MSADPRQAIHETVSVRRGLRRLVLHLWTIGFRILRHVIASRGFYETAGGSTFKESARARLDPAIHALRAGESKDVDARIKSGHDGESGTDR